MSLIDRLAIPPAFAAHDQDRGAARPVHLNPLRCRHAPQGPGQATTAFALAMPGLKQRLAAVGQPNKDEAKALDATVFDGNQEVGATLLEVEEKGGYYAARQPAPAGPQARREPEAPARP